MAQRYVVSAGLVYLATSSVSAGCWVALRRGITQADTLGRAKNPSAAGRQDPAYGTATPTSTQADSDEVICPQSNLANALNACSRLIDAGEGRFGPYFWRAKIYLRNEDYDHAIEDLSKFIQLNPKNGWALNDRGFAYEKKGELDKALADYQEAQNNGRPTASEDIKRISLRFKPLEAVQLAGGHYEMPGYRWVSDDIQVGGKPYTRVGLVWAPVEHKSVTPEYVVDGIRLGDRVSISDYQEYQCRPSEQFEGVTWCTKQRVEEELGARIAPHTPRSLTHATEPSII
jgi:hypothetical protein